jgi:hypothetical protein
MFSLLSFVDCNLIINYDKMQVEYILFLHSFVYPKSKLNDSDSSWCTEWSIELKSICSYSESKEVEFLFKIYEDSENL